MSPHPKRRSCRFNVATPEFRGIGMFSPSRLTLARQRRGLNKSELARRARLTVRTISAYEAGDKEPPTTTVITLAETLHFPETFFFGEELPAAPVDGVSFRALSKMTAGQRDAAIAAGALAMSLAAYLSDRFNLPSVDVPRLDRGITDPESAAMVVRTQWGLGEQPLPNLVHLLEAHGVRVFSLVEECREVDAFSFWHAGTPFVCLNTMKSAEHSRFDAAHELGHLVLHRDHGVPRGRQEEQEAHAFAAAFLMPRVDVVAHAPRFPGFQDLVRAKRRWSVSVAALAYRLRRLGLLSDWHYRELAIEIARYGRTREPNSIPRELSQLLTKAFGLLRSEGISRTTIARDLHLYPDELDALVFGLAVSVIEGGAASGTDIGPPELSIVRPG